MAPGHKTAGKGPGQMVPTTPDYPGERNNVVPSGERIKLGSDLAVLALGFEHDPIPGLPADKRDLI